MTKKSYSETMGNLCSSLIIKTQNMCWSTNKDREVHIVHQTERSPTEAVFCMNLKHIL